MRILFLTIGAVITVALFFYPSKETKISRRPAFPKTEFVIDKIETKNSSIKKNFPKEELNDLHKIKYLEEYFDLTGVEKQLSSIDRQLHKKLKLFFRQKALAKRDFDELYDQVKSQVGSKRLLYSFKKTFLNNLSDEEILELSELTQNPLIKLFGQKDEESSQVGFMDDESYQNFLDQYPLTEKRRELLSKLNQSTKSSEISKKLIGSLYGGILKNVGPLLFPDNKDALPFEKVAEVMFENIDKEVEASMIETLHLVYKDLTEQQIEQYIHLTDNSVLQKLPHLYIKAIDNTNYQQGQN